MKKKIISTLVVLSFSLNSIVFANSQNEHVKIITSSDDSYYIDVNGNIEPNNLEIIIENIGTNPIINPRITVNGKHNWYTLKNLVDEITNGCQTNEEKVWAIFQFVRDQSYWWEHPKDVTSFNTVRHYNIYGYHICAMAAMHFVALCRQAGIRARLWEIYHHTVAEVFFDGSWHVMDPDLGMWFLKDDNISIASMSDLEDHPELVARTFLPPRSYIVPGTQDRRIYRLESENAGDEIASWYATTSNNYVANHYDNFAYQDYSMDIILRPGEKLIRWWNPKLHKHYDQKTAQEPPRYANGQIIFEPNFRQFSYRDSIESSNISFSSEEKGNPTVRVKKLQNTYNDQPSRIMIPMRSPYVIVGGHIESTYYKAGDSKLDKLLLQADFNPNFYDFQTLWHYKAIGVGNCLTIFDNHILKGGFQSTYAIDFAYVLSADENLLNLKPDFPLIYGGQSGLDYIKIVLDLQVNPSSLPALRLSNNLIQYTDESNQSSRVKITYKWQERHGHKPSTPNKALFPKNGTSINTISPMFLWSSGNEPVDLKDIYFQFQLSLRSDCAWPLSPNFDRDIYGKEEFQSPENWLVPGTVYYWRVRAISFDGAIGPWSKIFSFSVNDKN